MTVSVVQQADTSLTKTLVEPNPLIAGAEVVYELTASNAGPSVATSVTIADRVPDGMTYVSGQIVGGEACPSPEVIDAENVVKCQAGSLRPGQSATARLVFKVGLHPETAELCNTALVGSGALDPAADNNAASACAKVAPPEPTDVGVTVKADNPKVQPGGPVSYTAVVRNNGPNPVTGTVVTFHAPPQVKDVKIVVVDHTGGTAPAPVCAAAGEVYTCAIGDIWPGETVTYQVTGTAASAKAEDLTLEAVVSHDGSDTDPDNDSDSAKVHVEPGSDDDGGDGGDDGDGDGGDDDDGDGDGGSGGSGGGGRLPYTGADVAPQLALA
ncbi:MAG: DUF11 domain-containing protein, partial [Bifidobacteriaceae bacterium]|nr:DUF11 domain-containing protein [Bifidobacteriaceae bacterium]